jgi:hypothetical protein
MAMPAGAAPARPKFKPALSGKFDIAKVKKYADGEYVVYRRKGENRFVIQKEEYPYTISSVFLSYQTIDCVTGWAQNEDKDHEKWLPKSYTHIPTTHKGNQGVVKMYRGYCSDMGVKPKF